MRIEQNQKMDANVVVTGNARQDNVAAAKKDASIVRIEKDRKADRLLEQPTYGKPEKEENAALPTDERLQRIISGGTDEGLAKLLFDYGRYLLIGCSRPGDLPATLQGIWNKDFMAPWDSKYTININTEMNYWPAEVCALPECHTALFDLIGRMREHGRSIARRMYDCRGLMAHHNTDLYGDCAPQDNWIPATIWTMGAAWLCTHLWMHYSYTQDLEFLKWAYPVMAEAALFFVDFLEEKDGYLVTNPSLSPENVYILPSGEQGCCCMGATMDLEILRELFTGCKKAAEILGDAVDEAEITEGDQCGARKAAADPHRFHRKSHGMDGGVRGSRAGTSPCVAAVRPVSVRSDLDG